jgi:hypothetical protein
MNDEYPSILGEEEKEAHLLQLYPPYVRPQPAPQEPVQPAPENLDLDIQETPDETAEELISEDSHKVETEEKALAAEQHKRLEESFSLVGAALAYPRKKRKPETEEQRTARVLSEILGGTTE